MSAVVDYRGSLGVGANEWLTVAARESVFDRRFVWRHPNDTAITIIVRIKGSDLQALREGTVSARGRAEAGRSEALLVGLAAFAEAAAARRAGLYVPVSN